MVATKFWLAIENYCANFVPKQFLVNLAKKIDIIYEQL